MKYVIKIPTIKIEFNMYQLYKSIIVFYMFRLLNLYDIKHLNE